MRHPRDGSETHPDAARPDAARPDASRPDGSRRGGTRAGRLLRRFLRERRGVTAVEFGFVAPPFFALIGAIIETALQFWCGQILDNALGDAARALYTGQFQQSMATDGTTDPAQVLEKLRSRICRANGDPSGALRTTIFDCTAVRLDVRAADNFGASSIPQPVDSSTGTWRLDTSANNGAVSGQPPPAYGKHYENATAGKIVVVQAVVAFPVFFTYYNPGPSTFTTGAEKGKRLLQSTAVFRTEPYQ